MPVRKAAMLLYRCCWLAFLALVPVSLLGDPPFPYGAAFVPAAAAVAIGVLVNRRSRAGLAKARPAVETGPPVTGRWTARNSPADRMLSHGTQGYGQTYAIDLVADPEEGSRPAFRWLWPVARPNRDFPAFGAPVVAVADATVVHASDGQRDHPSRDSGPALA